MAINGDSVVPNGDSDSFLSQETVLALPSVIGTSFSKSDRRMISNPLIHYISFIFDERASRKSRFRAPSEVYGGSIGSVTTSWPCHGWKRWTTWKLLEFSPKVTGD